MLQRVPQCFVDYHSKKITAKPAHALLVLIDIRGRRTVHDEGEARLARVGALRRADTK